MKKVSELSILCGVEACAVVLSPDENEPAFWPESRADVERILTRYLSIPEIERSRKMVTQEIYIGERISKFAEQHKRLTRKNNALENHHLMQQLYLYNKTMSELASTEMQGLHSYLEEKVAEIQRRIEYTQQRDGAPESGGAPSAVEGQMEEKETSPNANVDDVGGDGGSGGGDAASWDEWFSDMMKQSGNVAGSSASKRDTSYPLAYSSVGAGTSSHEVAVSLPQENVGVESGSLRHGGSPVYGGDNYPMMPYQGYVGDMSGGLPLGFTRGAVPGSGVGGAYEYATGPPYQWELGGSSIEYGAVYPHGGIDRSNTGNINAAMQPQEPGAMNTGQGTVLPVATGGGSGMGVHQRNDMVGVPALVPSPGNVNTGNAEYGSGVNQETAGARSQGGGHGGSGVVVPPGNTENEPRNAGADAGGSGGNN
ncbi:uncharacterized protein J3R85_014224 [Psidium guajava]|nr:uncharacterized protein J3R85_014224 [Psidium guajava]